MGVYISGWVYLWLASAAPQRTTFLGDEHIAVASRGPLFQEGDL
jgi:hypothetical protein